MVWLALGTVRAVMMAAVLVWKGIVIRLCYGRIDEECRSVVCVLVEW